MPPKKDSKQLRGSASEFDLTDAGSLPPLNEFVFTTLYAFKHRVSQMQVEHELFKQMDLSKEQQAEPEWLEAQKRNKVITVKDLTETAEQRGYLTTQEIQDNIGG